MNKRIFTLKFFSLIFLILFLNGCGNGEISYGQTDAIMSMANDGTYQLALDTSLIKFRLGFPCKYLAVSSNSTGQALAYVDSNWNMPILLYPGYSGLVNAKESLYVDVGPQPGKMLQLFFGDEPIISSPAAKFSPDAPINAQIFQLSKSNTGTFTQTIVTAAQNLNGIKILGGVIATFSGNGGGATITSANSVLYTIQGSNTLYLAASSVSGGPANSTSILFDSKAVSQIIIPPNQELSWNTGQVAGTGFTFASLILNYQLL